MFHKILSLFLLMYPWFGHAAQSKPAPIIRQAVTHQKVMALTFDDGPSPKWTPKVLRVLNQNHVKATFFLIGSHATRHPFLVHQEVEDKMDIGSHGAEHHVLKNQSAAAVRQEVEANAQILQTLGAPKPTLYRMPGGASDATALTVLGQLGYQVIGWSIDTRDWRHRTTAQAMAQKVEKEASPGAIVIFHDGPNGSEATVGAIQILIPTLKQEGYQFVTIAQLLHLEKSKSRI